MWMDYPASSKKEVETHQGPFALGFKSVI